MNPDKGTISLEITPCHAKRKFKRWEDARRSLANMLKNPAIPNRDKKYLRVYYCHLHRAFHVGKCHSKQRNIA